MTEHRNVDDLLIAQQLVGPNLARFQKLREAFPHVRFSTIADNAETARALNDIGQADQPIGRQGPVELRIREPREVAEDRHIGVEIGSAGHR